MPRAVRAVVAGCAHHVTQRGNNRQDVFFVDADRRAYLGYVQDAAHRFALRVEGYCLMTNHVHLVVTPEQETQYPPAEGLGNLYITGRTDGIGPDSGSDDIFVTKFSDGTWKP